MQTLPAQQPLAHEVASQTQLPALQRCPKEHAGPVPQPQVPVALHELVSIALQDTQVEPPTPQPATEGTVHTVPAQQPLAQFVPLQGPPVQTPLVQV